MKKIIFIAFLFFNAALFGQQTAKNITIIGKIMNQKTKQPLEFSAITLQDFATHKIVTGMITDNYGMYSLTTVPGKYNLKVESIGLKEHTIENLELISNRTLPTIYLEDTIEQLEAVVITAQKSTIEQNLDKRVFNVGNDLLSKGGSANDILNHVPSVSVNAAGIVSLRGNASVLILINGKPSVLTANNGLDQIPSENIEKVEVITNPSAKYGAEGTAGIINIVLKKNKTGGFGSSLQLTTGTPANNGLGYNVSYKTEKFNIFTDLRYRYTTTYGEENYLKTNYLNSTIDSFLHRTTDRTRNSSTYNLYLGGDYYINDKNTLTLSYYYRNNVGKNNADYIFNFLDPNANSTKTLNTTERYKEPQIANQIELNYIKNFAKEGQKLTANLQYDFWNDDENQNIIEKQTFPESNTSNTITSRNLEYSKDFLFQTDFSLPLDEKEKLEIGGKVETRRINSDYKLWDNAVLIDSLNNLFHYNENIYGAYLQYANNKAKFQYLLGLRVEHSNTGSTDSNNSFDIQKKYTDLFPNAHLTYSWNEATSMQLSYSRRIRRPSFWQLNPFDAIADRRNFRIGNPNLDPMYTDAYELGTLVKWRKFTFAPAAYYQYTTNLFETSLKTNSDGALIEQSINSGIENRMGAELNTTFAPYQWLYLTHEINYYTFKQKGIYTVNDNSWFSRLTTRIKLPSWSFQANFNYEGAKQTGQMQLSSEYWVDLAISKDFLKDLASLNLRIDNALDSRITKQYVTGNDYTVNAEYLYSGRRISATFIYRFNRKKSDKDRLPN